MQRTMVILALKTELKLKGGKQMTVFLLTQEISNQCPLLL